MEIELDLLFLWKIFKKRWAIVLILPIIIAFITGIIGYIATSKPMYQAITTLVMGNPNESFQKKDQADITAILASPEMAKIFEPVVKSRNVEQKVIDQLNLPLKVEEFNSKIEVNSIQDTDMIVINVIDENPQLAADIANTLAEKFAEVVIEIKKVDTVSVLDRAVTPDEPINVNIMKYVLGAFFITLLILLSLAVFIEMLDNKLRNAGDVQKVLDLPVIGMIPYDTDSLFNLNPLVSEAYRTLCTNVYFITKNVKKRIMVTSTGPREGKSVLAVNLAISLVQTGKRVLIIDANPRNRILHKLLKINEEVLFNAFEADSLEQGRVVQTRIQELDLFTVGQIPPNPEELLDSDNMKRTLADAEFAYDFVIIDSPPILAAMADVSILAQMVDSVIFVVGANEVHQDFALEAKEQLVRVGAKIIGVVLNKVDLKANDYKYYFNNGESSNERKTRLFNRSKIHNQPRQLSI